MYECSEYFENLKNKIVNDKDITLFDEIVECYKGGALRAAYIMTWISIIESLKQKLNQMAFKDSQVEKFVAEINENEKKEKSVDKIVLEKAKEYALVSSIEYEKLENVRKMRNIYAHPYQTGPSQEEVLAAIKIAIESVLSKPPLLRYGYVKEIIDSISKDFHYIDDNEEKIREFARNIAYKIHPETYSYIFSTACGHLESLIKESKPIIFVNRFVNRLVIFMQELFNSVKLCVDDSWNLIKLYQKFPYGSTILITHTRIWTLVSEQIRDMIIGNLLEPVIENKIYPPSTLALNIAHYLYQNGLMSNSQKDRFLKVINKTDVDYRTLAQLNIPLKLYIDKILEDLKKYTWPSQNRAGITLSNITPEQFFDLTPQKQEELGRNVLQASEGNAFDVINFLYKVYENPRQYPKDFIKGIFLETLINENEQFRLKIRYFNIAIMCVLNCEEETCFDILKNTEEKLKIASPKEEYNISSVKYKLIDVIDFLENLSQSIDKESVKQILLRIKITIESYLQKYNELGGDGVF